MTNEEARELLLKCLGPYFVANPEHMVYQYDATWKCERYVEVDEGIIWPDCATGTEQDVDKRMERRGLSSEEQAGRDPRVISQIRGMEQAAADNTKDIDWCRSCKAKKWLEDNPEVPA